VKNSKRRLHTTVVLKQLNLTTHMAKHANLTTQATVLSRDSLPTDGSIIPVNKSRQILAQCSGQNTANQWPTTKWRKQRNASTNTRQPINGLHSRLRITRQRNHLRHALLSAYTTNHGCTCLTWPQDTHIRHAYKVGTTEDVTIINSAAATVAFSCKTKALSLTQSHTW